MDGPTNCTSTHLYCQAEMFFITTILGVLIWLIHNHYATQKLRATATRIARAQAWVTQRQARAQAKACAQAPFRYIEDSNSDDGNETHWTNDFPSSPSEMSLVLDSNGLIPAREETPIMRRLALPGHHPTNAQLEVSPFRVAQRLGRRPGQPATPGYQTPSEPQAFFTAPLQHNNTFSGFPKDATVSYPILPRSGMPTDDGTPNQPTSAIHPGSFARFAQESPVSYDTQVSWMSNADVTPMPQWKTRNRFSQGTGNEFEQVESADDVVAHWSNVAGRKNGRAFLREELNDKELA